LGGDTLTILLIIVVILLLTTITAVARPEGRVVRSNYTADLWWKNAIFYCLDVETFMDPLPPALADPQRP
jgi:hypothetical protein